jgi:hypothetical protein
VERRNRPRATLFLMADGFVGGWLWRRPKSVSERRVKELQPEGLCFPARTLQQPPPQNGPNIITSPRGKHGAKLLSYLIV